MVSTIVATAIAFAGLLGAVHAILLKDREIGQVIIHTVITSILTGINYFITIFAFVGMTKIFLAGIAALIGVSIIGGIIIRSTLMKHELERTLCNSLVILTVTALGVYLLNLAFPGAGSTCTKGVTVYANKIMIIVYFIGYFVCALSQVKNITTFLSMKKYGTVRLK